MAILGVFDVFYAKTPQNDIIFMALFLINLLSPFVLLASERVFLTQVFLLGKRIGFQHECDLLGACHKSYMSHRTYP